LKRGVAKEGLKSWRDEAGFSGGGEEFNHRCGIDLIDGFRASRKGVLK